MRIIQTVYIDILFLTNVIVDYFLLLITAKFSFTVCSRWRLFCAALLGGLFAVTLFFLPYPDTFAIFIQAIVCVAICGVAFHSPPLRDLIRLSLVLFCSTLAFGGMIFALAYFTNSKNLFVVRGTIAYINLSLTTLLIGTGIAYWLLGIVFGNGSMRKKQPPTKVKIEFCGRQTELNAMCDTGNLLKEPLSGKKVIIVQKSLVKELFSEELKQKIETLSGDNAAQVLASMDIESSRKFALVPYTSVGAKSALMLALKANKIILDDTETKDYIIGISAEELALETGNSAIINI